MGLMSYKSNTKVVPLNDDNTVELKGLSLGDVTILVENYLQTIKEIFDKIQSGGGMDNIDNVVLTVAEYAPDLLADIIVLSSGEAVEGAREAVMRMPAALQIVLIKEVVELTFLETGGLKKTLELLTSVVNSQAKVAQTNK